MVDPPSREALNALTSITAVASLHSVMISLGMWDILRSWPQALRAVGWRSTISLSWLMAKTRHRAPFRAFKSYAPTVVASPPLVLGMWLATWTAGSFDRPGLYVALLALVVGTISLLILTAPPLVLFLGASQYEEFRVMKRVHVDARCYVVSLVDQASTSVLRHYREHYASIRSNMPAGTARAILTAWAPSADPAAPRVDSLRTRTALWRRTVSDLVDQVPIVLLDARNTGRQLQQEALWMLGVERCDRALFVSHDDGSAPLFVELQRLGVTVPSGDVRLLPEDQACAALRHVVRHPGPGLSPPARPIASDNLARAEQEWQQMSQRCEEHLERIRGDVNPDPELDAALCELGGSLLGDQTRFQGWPLTVSLDATLVFANAVLRRHPGECSFRIDIRADGSAMASIGVQDRPGNVVVFETREGDLLTPPRAVLDAVLQALLA